MLETILEWIEAGDTAVLGMGPIVATALAMLGASAFTQLLKFPLARFVPCGWEDWSIKTLSVVSTWIALQWLSNLQPMLELILALSQPIGYTVTMRVIRKFWPWMEATKVIGSVAPSVEAQAALVERRGDT